MLKARCALLMVCLVLAPGCFAADKPVELQPFIRSDKPFSTANFTKFLINVYDAEVWTDAPSWGWDQTFALTLHYHIDINQTDLTDKSIERMHDLTPLSKAEIADYHRQFMNLFSDVKTGDEITAVYFPHKSLDFYHNGSSTGSITDMTFAKRFLNIWFSKETSEPELRNKLIHPTSF